jgi:pimeloyl-ACP methyl ester carboxylesterase
VTPDGAFREDHVEADGFRIRYLDGGSGSPRIMLHGAYGPRLSQAAHLLAAGRRVIVPELPGFGTSPPNDRTADARQLAATVAATATALGLTAFDLLGTSVGGIVACWLAADAPDRVTALILEAPAAFRPAGAPSADQDPEVLARRLNVHPERLPAPPAPPAPEVMERTSPLVRRLMGPAHDEELAAALGSVLAPALVLFGTRDGIFPPEQGATYQQLMPNAFLSYVFDAAHDIQGDRPEAFAAVVSDFLDRHGEFLVYDGSTLIHQ